MSNPGSRSNSPIPEWGATLSDANRRVLVNWLAYGTILQEMINLFENEAFLEHRERYPDGAPTRRIPPHVLQQYLDDLDNAIGSARTDLANLNILACLPMTVHAALWLIPNSSIVRDPAIMQGFINLASFGVEATDALPAGTTSPPSQADIAARLIVRFRELVALDIEGSPSLEGVFGAIVECIVTGRHIRQIQGEIVDLLNQITLSFIDGASDQVTTSGSEAEEGEDGDEGNGPEFPSEAATNTELFYLEAERRLTDEDQKCMWCLYDVPAGEVATFLPCSHWFHPPCIRAWLRFNGHCPWCRQTINERIYKARYARVELDGRVIEASRRAEERRDAAVAAMQEAMSSAETDEERLRIQVEYQARVRRQIEEYRDELLYEDIIIPPWPLISAAITRGIPQPPREITSAHGRPRSQEEEEKQRRGHSAPGRTSGRPEWGSGTKREREEADEQGRPPKAAKGLHEGTAEHDEEIGEHGGATGEHDGEMSEHDSATGEHGCEGATGGRNSNNGSCSSRETPTRTNRNTPNERAHLGSRVSNSIRRVRDSAMARTQSIRRMVRSIRDRPRRTRTRRNPDQ